MELIFSLGIGLLVISAMITVHESGHFLGARLFGVRVDTFAIGWGKALVTWRKKETTYRINLFPLGGYCLMGGEGESSEDSLFVQSPLKKIGVFLLGPLFNLLLALLIFIPYFLLDYQEPHFPSTIVITADYPEVFGPTTHSPSRSGGLLSGDTILFIDDHKVEYFDDIQSILATYEKEQPMRFIIKRDGKELEKTIIPSFEDGKARVGLSYFIKPVIGEVSKDNPMNLEKGDTIVRLQHHNVYNTFDVASLLISQNPLIEMVVLRDGKEIDITYLATIDEAGNIVIPFSFQTEVAHIPGLSLDQSIVSAFNETFVVIVETYKAISHMISGKQSVSDSLAGPLTISYVVGSMRHSSLRQVLQIIAYISISLAIANLLPFPGLDGGAILLGVFEALSGKKVPQKWYMRYQAVGLSLLFILMMVVLFQDIQFLFLQK
ncbi:MAG: RIP metalloprotease RseP [Sphaerochaetaceae bacterium]